jgi:hypothetical protein
MSEQHSRKRKFYDTEHEILHTPDNSADNPKLTEFLERWGSDITTADYPNNTDRPIKRRVVPAPRLVGIETNPGPPKLGAILNGINSLLKAGNVSASSSAAVNKKKKKSKRAKRGPSGFSNNNLGMLKTTSQMVAAPVTTGMITRTIRPTAMSSFPINFSVQLQSFTGMTSPLNIISFDAISVATISQAIDLNPQGNYLTASSQTKPMGPELHLLALAFQRFRIRKLSVKFTPLLPTTTTGTIVLSYLNDPQTTNQSMSYSSLRVTDGAVTTPLYQTNIMHVPSSSLDKEWRYVQHDLNSIGAAQRQAFAGCVAVNTFGYAPALSGTQVGSLDFTGIIDFKDLAIEGSFGGSEVYTYDSLVPSLATETEPFGTLNTIHVQANEPFLQVTPTKLLFTKPGTYHVQVSWDSIVGLITAPSVASVAVGTIVGTPTYGTTTLDLHASVAYNDILYVTGPAGMTDARVRIIVTPVN